MKQCYINGQLSEPQRKVITEVYRRLRDFYEVTDKEIYSSRAIDYRITRIKIIIYYILNRYLECSTTLIGKFFCKKEHSYVARAIRIAKDNPDIISEAEEVYAKLNIQELTIQEPEDNRDLLSKNFLIWYAEKYHIDIDNIIKHSRHSKICCYILYKKIKADETIVKRLLKQEHKKLNSCYKMTCNRLYEDFTNYIKDNPLRDYYLKIIPDYRHETYRYVKEYIDDKDSQL